MIQRNNCKLRSRAEWAIGLCAVAPDSPADPFNRYPATYLIHLPGPIAMRNDPRIRHAQPERILALFDVAGVYARGPDPNPDFSGSGSRVRHLANDQHIAGRSLLLVPRCLHSPTSLLRNILEFLS